ncbi:hypothetical protein QQ054_01005 [Oscillatoria amoena NRMC-F 0135]|nr:hypothetical protein [Oscillatoria amoena NRMC-F 0135]
MKKLSLIACMLLFTAAFAQDEKKNLISGHIGLSIPMGLYGSTENKDGAQFASVGRNLQAMFTHTTGKFYVGGQLSLFANAMNVDEFNKMMLNETGAAVSATSASGFAGLNILGMIGYNLVKDKKTSFGAHIKPGLSSVAITSIDNRVQGNGNEVRTQRDAAGSVAFTTLLGYDVRFDFTTNFTLLLGMDYQVLSADFTEVPIRQYLNGTLFATDKLSGNSKFNQLMVNFGVGYRF